MKAKAYDPSKAEEIEVLYAKSIFDILQAYYEVLIHNLEKSKGLNLHIALGIGTAVFGSMAAFGEKTNMGKLMRLGLATSGSYILGNALNQK